MKTVGSSKLEVALTLAMVTTSAQGSILYDNLVDTYAYFQRYQGGSTLYETGLLAAQFSTHSPVCASGCTLSTITIPLLANSEQNPTGSMSGYRVQLFSDVGNLPGSALFTLHGPATIGNTASYQVFTPSGVFDLAPDTNYWVALTASTAFGTPTSISWISSPLARQKMANQPSQFAYWPFGPPIIYPDSQFMMKVEAVAQNPAEPPMVISEPGLVLPGPELTPAVPLPGAAWLMSSALLGFTAFRRSGKRNFFGRSA